MVASFIFIVLVFVSRVSSPDGDDGDVDARVEVSPRGAFFDASTRRSRRARPRSTSPDSPITRERAGDSAR